MDAGSITAAETVSASKKLGRDEAMALLDAVSTVHVAKGKSLQTFSVAKADRDELVEKLLGPTGNLRAPTIRRGKTLLVGFDHETYAKVLGR